MARHAINFPHLSKALIRAMRAGEGRHPIRNLLIRCGVVLITVALIYLGGALIGLVPIETESLAWNNIRIVSGTAILGCLLAAIGYGNE